MYVITPLANYKLSLNNTDSLAFLLSIGKNEIIKFYLTKSILHTNFAVV